MEKNNQNEAGQKLKKPLYKKWWFWLIIVAVVIALASNPNSSDDPATDPAQGGQSTTESTASDALDLDVTFSKDFRNDITGNWRKALVSTSSEIQEYALAYYQEYFTADDEVHVIYNFGLNTVNCLTVTGNILSINITDYVDGEEHDAKIACGGTYLGSFQIDIETGEVLYSSFDE